MRTGTQSIAMIDGTVVAIVGTWRTRIDMIRGANTGETGVRPVAFAGTQIAARRSVDLRRMDALPASVASLACTLVAVLGTERSRRHEILMALAVETSISIIAVGIG